jgi:drug/metabolite transporter (DMT)-like permease
MPNTAAGSVDRRAIWVGLAILYGVWGSTYLAIAVAVDTLPPFLMAAARFGLAGLALLAWVAIRRRENLTRPSRRQLLDSTVIGALLLGGGMGLVAWGEQTIPSGITAVVVAMMPVWVAIFGGAFFGDRLPRIAGLGIVVGFVGVAILVGPTALGAPEALDAAGVLAILVAPIAWSIGSLYASHRARLPGDPLVATGMQMVAGSLVLALMAVATREPARFEPARVSIESLAAFLYLTVIGSVLAFTTFGWMLRVAPLPLVATYAYVNPVIAVILGALILAEPIEPRMLLAGAIIVGAVALIVTARGRMATPRGALPRPTIPPAPSEPRAAPAPSRSTSG